MGWLTTYDASHFTILIRASSYFSFVRLVLVGVAFVFELPLVVLRRLSRGSHVVDLRRNRRKGY